MMEGRAQGKENELMEKIIKKCEGVKKKWAPRILKQKMANIPSLPVTTPPLLPEAVLKSCGAAMEAESSEKLEVKRKQEFLRIKVGRDAQSQTEDYADLDHFAKLQEMNARKECRPQFPQRLLPNITELMPLVLLPIPQPVQTPHIQIIEGPTLYKCDTCQLLFPSKVQILEHLVIAKLAQSRVFPPVRKEASSTDKSEFSFKIPSTGGILRSRLLEKQDNIPVVKKKEHLPATVSHSVVPVPREATFIDNPSSATSSTCAVPKSELLEKPDNVRVENKERLPVSVVPPPGKAAFIDNSSSATPSTCTEPKSELLEKPEMKKAVRFSQSHQQMLNEQERIRRLNQNSNLKFLQESLPALEERALERVSQIEVLAAAIWFIKHLKEEETDLCNVEKELRDQRDILLRKRQELMSSQSNIQDGLLQLQPNQDYFSSNGEDFAEKEPEVKACSSEQSRESPAVESVIGMKTVSRACSPDVIQAFSRRTLSNGEQQNHGEEDGDGKPEDDEEKGREEPVPKKLKRNPSLDVIHGHITILSSDPPLFKCNICKKKFKTKAFIKHHEICEIRGDEHFKCETCGKGFPSKSRCKYHSRIHTGMRPFACTYCDKRFTDKSNLNRHLGIHREEPRFSCSHCDKTFVCQSLLDFHLLTHPNPKTYACDHCTRTFASNKALRSHLVIHSAVGGEAPFECPICQASFGRKFNRDRHIIITHKDAH